MYAYIQYIMTAQYSTRPAKIGRIGANTLLYHIVGIYHESFNFSNFANFKVAISDLSYFAPVEKPYAYINIDKLQNFLQPQGDSTLICACYKLYPVKFRVAVMKISYVKVYRNLFPIHF